MPTWPKGLIPQPWNLFSDIAVDEGGSITDRRSVSGPGDNVQLRAEMDLVLAVVVGPQDQHPSMAELEDVEKCTEVEYRIYRPMDSWDGMEQFVSPFQRLAANSAGKVIAEAGIIFDQADTDKDGHISAEEFSPLMRSLWESLGTGMGGDDIDARRELQSAVDAQLGAFASSGSGRISYREFMTMLAAPPWNLLLHDALERSIKIEKQILAQFEETQRGIALLETQRQSLMSLWGELDKGNVGHVDGADSLFDILDPEDKNRISYNKLQLCHGLDTEGYISILERIIEPVETLNHHKEAWTNGEEALPGSAIIPDRWVSRKNFMKMIYEIAEIEVRRTYET